jgi:membrane protein implicated in regulation of membrane protease activity
MTAVYLAAFVVGGIAVLSALLLTDIGHSGMPFLSLTGLSGAVLGAGTGGLVAMWVGLGTLSSAAVAVASALILVLALHGVLLPYLRRQESNSQHGRSAYIGLLGTVTLDVPVGSWGEVAFVDPDGNRVRARAITSEPDVLTKATRVYIADVDADYVHVVAVPDTAFPDN